MNTIDFTYKRLPLIFIKDLSNNGDISFKKGYNIAFFQPGDNSAWKEIVISSGLVLSEEEANDRWVKYYSPLGKEVTKRVFFLINDNHEKIGTATAYINPYTGDNKEGFVFDVAIKKEYQGQKLAKSFVTFVFSALEKMGYSKAYISTETTQVAMCNLLLDLKAEPFNSESQLEAVELLNGILRHPSLSKFNKSHDIKDVVNANVKKFLDSFIEDIDYFRVYKENNKGVAIITSNNEKKQYVFSFNEEGKIQYISNEEALVKVNIRNVRLETNRTILRPFNSKDLKPLFEIVGDEDVAINAGFDVCKNALGVTPMLSNFVSNKSAFAIVNKENNKLIGFIDIHNYYLKDKKFVDSRIVSLGFSIHPEYQSIGIMSEALPVVLNYIKEKLDIEYVFAGHFTTNEKCAALLKKLEFTYYEDYYAPFFKENVKMRVKDYYKKVK